MRQNIFTSPPESNVDPRGTVGLFALTEDAKEGQKTFQEKRKPNGVGH